MRNLIAAAASMVEEGDALFAGKDYAGARELYLSALARIPATQAGYEVGTRNVVDVLNAQNTLFIAERDYFNSRYDYIVNMLRLKEQAGTLSPEDIYNFDAFLVPPPPPTAPPATQ